MPQLSDRRKSELAALGELLAQPGLHKTRREEVLATFEELQLRCGLEDPWYFLRHLCYTLNEHAPKRANAYQNFPDHPYLEHMARKWEEVAARDHDRVLGIWKSRQMMATWFVMAMTLWTILDRVGSLVLLRSRKEADAAAMISRIGVILRKMPGKIQELLGNYQVQNLVIELPMHDARIEGIPQGAAQVHGRTPTILADDELALQEEAESGFAEAQPAIEGGGMYVALSSARPGFMHRWVNDRT